MIRTTPEVWNHTLIAGATLDETWTVTDSGGTAVDLTGCSGTASCRTGYGTAATVAMTFGTANLILGGTAGTLRFLQTAATTAALGSAYNYEAGELAFDCEITEAGGDVSRVLAGIWSVSPEVTR